MRRYTRLSNGFSRKLENHAAATALNYFAYNFIKIHRTLRMSPAMAAGVTDRLWEVSDLVALWEAYEQRRAERAASLMKHVRQLPVKKGDLRRFRVTFWFLGLTFIGVGCIRLLQGQSAYISISGTIFTPLLIVLGLFFIAVAILWRPRTRPDL